MLIRCSSLSDIMTLPRSGKGLSETAKARIEKDVKRELYGFYRELGTPEIRKGRECEDEAIHLIGSIHCASFKKNTERRENQWLTGEPDIIWRDYLRDMKCSWDIDTHPLTVTRAYEKSKKAGYDWQMRGYMMLWGLPRAYVDFLMIPTPLHLLRPYEDVEMNVDCVQNMPLEDRVVTVSYDRDLEIENQIKERCEMAQEYAAQIISERRGVRLAS